MGSAGVVRAGLGGLIAVAVVAVGTGCGSATSSASGEEVGPLPATNDYVYEPPAEAATGDPFASAVDWPLTPGKWASIGGRIFSTGQIDVYSIGAVYRGDQLHVEVLASTSLDAAVAVLDDQQDILITNDDRSYYGGLVDPLAKAKVLHSSQECYVAVAVSPKAGGVGGYTLEVLLTEEEPPDAAEGQQVYLNFDGMDNVRIGSRPPVDVPVFDAAAIDESFAGYTDEIIDNVVALMQQDYTGLNIHFHSSRDEPPPDGPHSVLHFGEFDDELLGVAENVDEYNLSISQNAVIFTDTFGAFSVLDPSVEEISQALANVASHEAGHLLGLYHSADARGIMDVTASLRQMLGDQSFLRSPLHEEYFPAGFQDSLQMLVENIGGDLVLAKQAAAAQLENRAKWYDAVPGPPARARQVFSSCSRCLHDKASQHQKHMHDDHAGLYR